MSLWKDKFSTETDHTTQKCKHTVVEVSMQFKS